MPAPPHLHDQHNHLLWFLTHLLFNLSTTLSHQKASRPVSDEFVKIVGATSHRRNKRYYGMLCDVSKFSGFLRPRVCPSPQLVPYPANYHIPLYSLPYRKHAFLFHPFTPFNSFLPSRPIFILRPKIKRIRRHQKRRRKVFRRGGGGKGRGGGGEGGGGRGGGRGGERGGGGGRGRKQRKRVEEQNKKRLKEEEEWSSERKLEEGEKEQSDKANLEVRGEVAEQKEPEAQKERRTKKGKRVKWKKQVEAIEDANEHLKEEKKPKVKRKRKAKSQTKKNDEKLEKGDKTLPGRGWANVGERVRGVGGRAISFANPVARELAPRALRVAAPGVGAAIGTMALGPAGGMMGRAIGNKAADYLSGNMQNSMPTSEDEKNRMKTASNVADVAENLWNKRRV